MRKSFSRAALEILKQDAKVSVLLGDIGVFGFKDSFEEFPERVFNIGILESATDRKSVV